MKKIVTRAQEPLPYTPITAGEASAAGQAIARIVANIESVIKGKHDQVELTVLCLLAEGHVLIEDIPGVARPVWSQPWPGPSTAPASASSSPRT